MTPEEAVKELDQAFARGDIEAVLAFYEDGAAVVPGSAVTGSWHAPTSGPLSSRLLETSRPGEWRAMSEQRTQLRKQGHVLSFEHNGGLERTKKVAAQR